MYKTIKKKNTKPYKNDTLFHICQEKDSADTYRMQTNGLNSSMAKTTNNILDILEIWSRNYIQTFIHININMCLN